MVSFNALFAVLAATCALASPMPVSENEASLLARAGQIYICKAGATNNGALYGEISYDKSIGFFREAKTNTGASGYPKAFDNRGNVMKFASGCSKDVWELPVLASNTLYKYKEKKDGNSPGTMRVYHTKDLKFCGIGAKLNSDGSGNPHNCVLKQ